MTQFQFRQYAPDLYSGGQPAPADLARLAREGVRTVINLRAAHEPDQYDERAEAERLGMRYVAIPVAGAQDLDPAVVQRFADEIARAREAGPVLVHCASANRVGALVALEQAWHRGRDAADALGTGRAAGLTSLEPAVSELIARRPA